MSSESKKVENAAETEESGEAKPSYVSDQLAIKTWSVLARFLHEGAGILTLHKAWDRANDAFVVVPWYADGQPEAIQPDVWTCWRHELKAPLGGHAFIRDYAEVVDRFSITSEAALGKLVSEHGLMLTDAKRRFQQGEPGLVALALRVYHLPRSYKLYDIASFEGDSERVPLPFDVELEDLTPAVEDVSFERRLAAVRSVLG